MRIKSIKNLSRLLLSVSIGVLITIQAVAQKPIITSVVQKSGSANETISIKGSNFGGDKTKITVFFGATKGTVITTEDQLIEAKAPAGATYNSVSVTHATSGLTGYSKEQFLLSFNGQAGFDVNNLVGQSNFDAESGLYDLCMSDFDDDKRVDIVAVSTSSNLVSIFKNTSSGAGNINFTKASINLGALARHVKCGDLNGDGKPDVVMAADVADEIYILKNNSSGAGNFTFGAPIVLKFGVSRKPEVIDIADLDGDGLPEIIFSDAKSNKVSVLKNQSTQSAIQMVPTPIDFVISEALNTEALFVKDLDGDNLPEIAVSQFNTDKSNLFILANKSSAGNVNFDGITKIIISGAVKRIRFGDLDGDNKTDIAVTQLISKSVSVFLNQSTPSSFVFGSPKVIPVQENPWGLDLGDLDGDGKADIVVSSVKETNLVILNNTTASPGNVTFTSSVKPTTWITKHVQIGDLDGDGKPDVGFTSIDYLASAPIILSSKLSVFRNSSCMIPKITPIGPLTICSSAAPLRLDATVSAGTTYEWKNKTTNLSVKNSADAFYDVSTAGQNEYEVIASAEGGACVKTSSNSATITVISASSIGAVSILPAGPICTGSTLQLKLANPTLPGVSGYRWSGPNGYASTGATPAPISNFALENTGRYYVEVLVGTSPSECVTQKPSVAVGIIDINDFKVAAGGSDILCNGDPAKILSVSPAPADFNFQWFEKTLGSVSANGPTQTTYSTSTAGEYYVKATSISGNCNNKETLPVKISVAQVPVVAFSPAEACKGQETQFTSQSVTDPSLDAFYLWDFGNSQTSDELSPKHVFNASPASVKLTISYKNGACAVSLLKSVALKTAPVIAVTNPENKYALCPDGELKLEVLGSQITSYTWSNGETTPSIIIDSEGLYKVEVKTAGCVLKAERLVKQIESTVVVTADPPRINEGQTSQLSASGLESFSWTPAESLSNANSATPVASAVGTTIYTVTGKDKNDCTLTGTVELTVIGEAIVNKLTPSNFFSPNKSGPVESELWQVEKILDYPQCNVAVYDDKGIKVFEAKPYANDWDGTFKGRNLPDGVYYYVIRCDGEESKPKSGSITLLR